MPPKKALTRFMEQRMSPVVGAAKLNASSRMFVDSRWRTSCSHTATVLP